MFDYSVTANDAIGWQQLFQATWAVALAALVGLVALVAIAPRGRSTIARAIAGRSLRSSLLISTMLVSMVPALTMAIVLAERSAKSRFDQVANRLSDTAEVAANEVDLFLGKNRDAVSSAASAISVYGQTDSAALFRWLGLYHGIYTDFLTMLAADGAGSIVTATTLLDGQPAEISMLRQQNISDRSYFKVPARDKVAFVSDVFRGRGLGNDPIVAISAPLSDADGNFIGIVEGSLNLRAFARVEQGLPMVAGSELLILDEQRRVIYASASAGLEILESLADSASLPPATAANIAKRSVRTGGYELSQSLTANGWGVVVRVPASVLSQQTSGDYRLATWLTFIALLMALGLATMVSKRVAKSVGELGKSVERFTLDGDGANYEIPPNTPAEFLPVFEHMRRRSRHLRTTHQRLKHSIETGKQLSHELSRAITEKESEIEDRTRDLRESNEKLQDLSRKDALTGISNRRGFEAFDSRMRRMCQRDGKPLTTIMVDIDHFKAFNDHFGHNEGDKCLRQVAQALRACAHRPLDLVARFGGEEFIAVLATTPVETGVLVAERMRQAVRNCAIAHPKSPLGVVTVSIGVAGSRSGESSDSTESRTQADEALYAAKAAGRDTVCFASDGRFIPYDSDTAEAATLLDLRR